MMAARGVRSQATGFRARSVFGHRQRLRTQGQQPLREQR